MNQDDSDAHIDKSLVREPVLWVHFLASNNPEGGDVNNLSSFLFCNLPLGKVALIA